MSKHVHHTRVAVIGAGSWGTALANLLATRGYEVSLWARAQHLAQRMTSERENALYLPGVSLHTRLTSTADFAAAAYATTAFISVVPSHAVRTVWEMLSPMLPD